MTFEQMVSAANRQYVFTFEILGGRVENSLRIEAATVEQAKLRAEDIARVHGVRVRLRRVSKLPQ